MNYKIQDFTETEIGELRLYIEKHVPNHILNNMYSLSDNITDKMTIFIGIYRILNSCSNYASTEEMRTKINYFLKKCEKSYNEIFLLASDYSITRSNYGKHEIIKQVSIIVEKNYKEIHDLVDLFIVLGEQIQLIKTSAVIGIDILKDDDFSKDLVKEARKIAEGEGA